MAPSLFHLHGPCGRPPAHSYRLDYNSKRVGDIPVLTGSQVTWTALALLFALLLFFFLTLNCWQYKQLIFSVLKPAISKQNDYKFLVGLKVGLKHANFIPTFGLESLKICL